MPLVKITFDGRQLPGIAPEDIELLDDAIKEDIRQQQNANTGANQPVVIDTSLGERLSTLIPSIKKGPTPPSILSQYRQIEREAFTRRKKPQENSSIFRKDCATLLDDMKELPLEDQRAINEKKQHFNAQLARCGESFSPEEKYTDADLLVAYQNLKEAVSGRKEAVLRRKRLQKDIDDGQILFPNLLQLKITFIPDDTIEDIVVVQTSEGAEIRYSANDHHPLGQYLTALKIPLNTPQTISSIQKKHEEVKKEKGNALFFQEAARELKKVFRRISADRTYQSLSPAAQHLFKEALQENVLPAVLKKLSTCLEGTDLIFVPRHEEVIIEVVDPSNMVMKVQLPGKLSTTDGNQADALLTCKVTTKVIESSADDTEVAESELEAIGEDAIVQRLPEFQKKRIEDDEVPREILGRYFMEASDQLIIMTRAFNHSDKFRFLADQYLQSQGKIVLPSSIVDHIKQYRSYVERAPIKGMLRWLKDLMRLVHDFAIIFFNDPIIKRKVEALFKAREDQSRTRTEFFCLMAVNVTQLVGEELEKSLRTNPEFASVEGGEPLQKLLTEFPKMCSTLVIELSDNPENDDFIVLNKMGEIFDAVAGEDDSGLSDHQKAVYKRIITEKRRAQLPIVYSSIKTRLQGRDPIESIIDSAKFFARGDERVFDYCIDILIGGQTQVEVKEGEEMEDSPLELNQDSDLHYLGRLLTFVTRISPQDSRLREKISGYHPMPPLTQPRELSLWLKAQGHNGSWLGKQIRAWGVRQMVLRRGAAELTDEAKAKFNQVLEKQHRQHLLIRLQLEVGDHLRAVAGDAKDFSAYKASRTKWYQPIHRSAETAFLMQKIIADALDRDRAVHEVDAAIDRLHFLREELPKNDSMFTKVFNFITFNSFTGLRKGWLSKIFDKLTFGAWSQIGGSQLYRNTAELIGTCPFYVNVKERVSPGKYRILSERYLPNKKHALYKLLEATVRSIELQNESLKGGDSQFAPPTVPAQIMEAWKLLNEYELFELVNGGHTCIKAAAIKVQSAMGQLASLSIAPALSRKLREAADEVNPLPKVIEPIQAGVGARLKRANSIGFLPGYMTSSSHTRRPSRIIVASPEAVRELSLPPPLSAKEEYIRWLERGECKSAEEATLEYDRRVKEVQHTRDHVSLAVQTSGIRGSAERTPVDDVPRLSPASDGSDGAESARTVTKNVNVLAA